MGHIRYQAGKALVQLSDTRKRSLLCTLLAGLGAAEVDHLSHLAGWYSALDSTFVGLCAAAVVWLAFSATRTHRQHLREQMRVVANLNHSVRNALQGIVSSQIMPQARQTEILLENVQRIDATLRELFPAIGDRVTDRQYLYHRPVRAQELLAMRRRGELRTE